MIFFGKCITFIICAFEVLEFGGNLEFQKVANMVARAETFLFLVLKLSMF